MALNVIDTLPLFHMRFTNFENLVSSPEWLSAITAVAALLFGLPSLLQTIKELRKKGDNQDKMIEALSEQVKELSKQSTEFSKQTEIMKYTLKVYEEMLAISTKDFSFKEAEAKAKAEIILSEERKLTMPRLAIAGIDIDNKKEIKITLRNVGKEAVKAFFNIEPDRDKVKWYIDIQTTYEFHDSFPLPANQEFLAHGYIDSGNPRLNINNVEFHIYFNLEDVKGNQYIQSIKKKEGEDIVIDEEPKFSIS